MWLKKAITVDYIDNLLRDKKYLQALAAIADSGESYPHVEVILEDAYAQITSSVTHDPQEDFKLRLLTALVARLDLGLEFNEIIKLREEEERDDERGAGEVWDESGHKSY